MDRGRFITFEGGEGAGKSTQIARLAEWLGERDVSCVVTREPGGSTLAERIRDLLLDPTSGARTALTETLLFYAARADHLSATIRPALSGGKWVLCDRFSDSTRAYQGAADGVPASTLAALETVVVGAETPDLTILLDLPAEEGLRRAQLRAAESSDDGRRDPFELRDKAFHNRLRDGFLALAEAEPERFVVLDAAQSVEALAKAIRAVVAKRLALI